MARAVLIRRLVWALALTSLTFGVWRSAQPENLVDFARVMAWADQLVGGHSPYGIDSDTDYPPWALVTMAPMVAVPTAAQPLVWILGNLLLAVAVSLLLVRHAQASRDTWWLLLGLLLAASCFRVLGQFSLLSFALALAGARHPSVVVGGLLLGLGLMKPQVGGALWLAHVLMGDGRRAAIAAAVPILLTLLASGLTGVAPLSLLVDWARTLEAVHGGRLLFVGHTELEAWLAPLIPAVTTVPGAMGTGLLLLIPAVIAAWRERRRWSIGRQLELYALCGVVSLLSTRHLAYDLLLVLPVVVAWWDTRWRPAWLVTVALLILQVPGWWRRVFEPMGWPDQFGVIVEVDRLLCIGLFGLLSWSLLRLDVTK